MWSPQPSFRFEIEKFKEKQEAGILSKVFVAGGYEWLLHVYPKKDRHTDDPVSVYLRVANPKSLPIGWKRSVNFYFTALNHCNIECCRTNIAKNVVFAAENPSWGFRDTFPLSQLEEKCFIEKNSLIIEVYINVNEDVLEKETVDINGFQVSTSHIASVRKIFAEHPDIAFGFKPKNQVVKTAYMNVLLGVINRLNKPSQSHSESELITTHGELSELEEVGFKIDWLKSKLENIFLERKKDDADGSRVQQLEERVKNLEKKKNKMASLKRKVDELLLERKKAKADEPRVEKLEERVKNLEVMESGFKMDCLKSKLEGVSLEKKKADDSDGSRVQKLEESVKNLETMVSDLKAKLDEKAKSSSDEFLLV